MFELLKDPGISHGEIAVGIMIRQRTGNQRNRGSIPWRGEIFFFFKKCVDRLCGSSGFSFTGYSGIEVAEA